MQCLKRILFLILPVVIFSCRDQQSYPPATDAFDAGREFLDGCLKGDFNKAAFYMVSDSTNSALLLKQEKNYKEKGTKEKQQYHDASLIINEDAVVNDSMQIINYENSYDKTPRKVKVVFRNNNWLVDFKYTFDGNL